MGAEIDKSTFTDEDFSRFRERLPEQLSALDKVLARPGFGVAPRSIGAELELFLVDPEGQPLALGPEVLARLTSPRVSHELARFGTGTARSTTRRGPATCASSCARCRPGPPCRTCWPTPPSSWG